MISNRRGARPSSSPIEHLREFAINTSKGIDITQAPVNNDTVVHAKNLIVNPDGSLSLRKPLKQTSSSMFPTHTLFDGSVLTTTGSDTEVQCFRNGMHVNVNVEWYSYRGTKHEWFADDGIVGFFEDCSKISVLNLNTSSIICNANLIISWFNDHMDETGLYPDDYGWMSTNIVDKELYDEEVWYVPRYIKVTKGIRDGEDILVFTVLNPEPNELRFGTNGEFALDPNLVLDNPYAIQDSYGMVSTIAKGIVGYRYSTQENARVVPAEMNWKYFEKDLVNEFDDHYLLSSLTRHASLRYTPGAPSSTEVVFRHVMGVGYIITTTVTVKFDTVPSPYPTDSNDVQSIQASIKVVTSPIRPNALSAKLALTFVPLKIIGTASPKDGTEVFKINDAFTFNPKSADLVLSNGEAVIESDSDIAYKSFHSPFDYEFDVVFSTGLLELLYIQNPIPSVSSLNIDNVPALTESVKQTRFRIFSSIASDANVILKAFGNPPTKASGDTYWAAWFATWDGVSWAPVLSESSLENTQTRLIDSGSETTPTAVYFEYRADSKYDTLEVAGALYKNRPDILPIALKKEESPIQFKFRVVTVGSLSEEEGSSSEVFLQKTLVSEAFYTVPWYFADEFAHLDFANAVYGNKLYHKKRIYSYGHEKFFNNIFVSGIDNFETLLYNVIDIDAKQSDTATALVPWRDYLMSATTNAMYLHTPQDNGFLTKTVTTSLGIPKEDSDCCVPVLNGVIVKSNSKVYLIYPNAYAGTDDVLNLAPISQPVEEYLQDFEDFSEEKPFAFSTESEYILMLPYAEKTICLRYNYTTRIWCMCEYPVRLYDYRINNVEDIRLYGVLEGGAYAEFEFDSDSEVYADIIGKTEVPIEFEWDSGQKTDNIATRKQFTESKIVFSTEDEVENFPMELIVAVDGDPNVTRIDVRTDAPLIKTTESVGVLGTNLRLSEDFSDPNVSKSGLIRQLIVRYSGRGRSVRHILRGTAKSPFRMYEAYVRYKLIDNKR